MSVRWRNKRGKEVTLLNPSEKGRKYANELKDGIKYTNDGVVKTDKSGNYQHLSDTEAAWRSGYLQSQKDSANCWKAMQGKQSGQSKKSKSGKSKSRALAKY